MANWVELSTCAFVIFSSSKEQSQLRKGEEEVVFLRNWIGMLLQGSGCVESVGE